jgi:YD repeat-containing protein
MVAIVAGQGLGLGQTSARTLGASGGVLGNPAAGYLGSSFFVNAASGNVVIQNQDEVLTGIGQDTALSRTYNSLGLLDDDNGDNWRESSQRTVAGLTGTVSTAGSTITRTDWDGSRQVFTWDAAKAAYVYKDAAGAYDKLTFSAGTSQWTWTDGDSRVIELYDNANGGRIVSSLDPDGKGQTFAYTGAQLTRITDSNGEYVVLAWSGVNLIQLSTYKSDNTLLVSRVRYGYDASNRLTSVTVDLSPSDNTVADGKTVVYTYTYDGTSKRVASIGESGSAAMVAFTYNQTTFKVTQVTETAASGSVRTYSFDFSVANRFRVTDSQSQVTDYFVDASGRLTSVAYPTAQTVQYTWDAATGRLASVTDALNAMTTFTYDANNNRTRTTDAAGNVVDQVYDPATNALLTETHYLLPDPDGAGAGTASSPVTTRYSYDALSHLRFAVSAEGQVTEYRYDTTAGATWKLANTISYTANFYDVSALATSASPSAATMTTWAAGLSDKSTTQRTDMIYDFRGNLSTVTTYSAADAAGTGLTTAPYTVATYVYDQFGLLLSQQLSGRTGSQVYTYDGLGRMLTSTDFAGNQTQVAYDNANRRTVMTLADAETVTTNFNAFGQALDRTTAGSGATGQVESYKYDSVGRLRTVVDAFATKDYVFYDASGRSVGHMDRLGNMTEYKYDAANRLVATIEYATAISAPNRTSLFDVSGNPTNIAFATVRPAANTADLWSWNIYDAANRLVEAVAADGAVTQYTYDGASQLVLTKSFVNRLAAATLTGFKTTTPTALTLPTTNAKDPATRLFYDKAGQQIGVLDADGALTRSVYDAAGRAIETVQYASLTTAGLRVAGTWSQLLTSVTSPSNAADHHQYFAYDDQGNLRFTLDANLRPVEIVYNSVGDAVRTISYGAAVGAIASYTAAYIQSQITTLSLAANAATRISRTTYDGAGRPAFSIDAQGGVIAYAYNSLSQVVKVTQYLTAFATVGDQTLAIMQSWATTNANTSDRVTRSVYDGLGRDAYDVDAAGYVTEHQYDIRNRVTKDIRYPASYAVSDSVTRTSLATQIGALPAGAISVSYLYDGNGNRTQMTDGEGVVTTYAYDSFGRETLITNVTANTVTKLVYDAVDRISQRTSAFGSSAAATVGYAYDGAGNLTAFTDARNNTTLYTYDALGNRLTERAPLYFDATPTVVYATTTNQYDAFGNVAATTDPRGNTAYYYYDKLDRLHYAVDPEGYATETQYSIGDAVLSVRRMVAKPVGTGSTTTLPVFSTSAADALTTFTRDRLDRVTAATDAGSFHEDYTLNAFGDRTSVANKLGGVTANLYDKRGLLIQETLPVGSTKSDGTAQAGGNIVNKFEYDASGNRTRMVEAFGFPEQRTTDYTYDKDGQLKSKVLVGTFTLVNGATMAQTTVSNITEYYSYDSNGNLTEAKDGAGNRTLTYYDAANRKIAQVSAVGTLSAWSYDANGNVQTARIYGDAVALLGAAGGTAPAAINASNYRETVFGYDLDNRLLTSTVIGITTGRYVGSTYTTSAAPIVAQNQYDAAGNLVLQIDANGGKIITYYNKNGQKVGQIDQAGYVTSWALDQEGNVLTEVRYANKYIGTPGTTLPLPTANATNDRTTQFTYDKNGRRLTEARLNVQAATVSGSSVNTATVTATITYTYNGLGLVTSKQEATGDTTNYGYDQGGRQTSIVGQSFTDYSGATVNGRQDLFYDGLSNVSRSLENTSRVSTYTYAAAGRLAASIDGANNATSYTYDAVGRITSTSYTLIKASGATQTIAQAIGYDAAARQTTQQAYQKSGAAWNQTGDTTENFFNAYGEVIARGTNAVGNIANAQEFNEYDKAGRLWRTNFNDGVTKAYLYDANGNATLLLQSIGVVNLKSGSFVDATSMLINTGISKTISVFDLRNQLAETIQTASNNSGASPVHATLLPPEVGSGTVYFDGNAWVNPTNRVTTGATASTIQSSSGVTTTNAGTISLSMTANNGVIQAIYINKSSLPSNGGLNVHVELEGDHLYSNPYAMSWVQTDIVDLGAWSAADGSISITDVANRAGIAAYQGWTYLRITVWQEAPSGGRINLLQTQISGTLTTGSLNGTAYAPAQIQFQNENPNTAVVRVFGRQLGSAQAYLWVGTAAPLMRADGSAVAGWFNFDASGMSGQNWELLYYAADGSGNVLDAKSAVYGSNLLSRLQLTSATTTYASQNEPIYINGSYLSSYPSANPSLAWADLYVRPAGSSQGFSYLNTTAVHQQYNPYTGPYASADFPIDSLNIVGPSGTSAFEFQIAYRDANGSTISVSTGVLNGNPIAQPGISASPIPVNGPGQALMFTHNGGSLLFSALPSNTQNVNFYYRQLASGGAFTWQGVYGGAYGQPGWWWTTPPLSGGPYEFWVEPIDGSGNLVGNRSYGTYSPSGQPSGLTQYAVLPKTIKFSPPSGHTVTNQRMRYFANGTWSGWIDYLAGGEWNFDAGSLAPSFYDNYSYQIEYETFNGPTRISRATGTMALGYNGQGVSLTDEWGITAKVQFNPLQTAGSQLKLFWRDQGSTGDFTAAVLNKSGNFYAWDVDGVRPPSDTRRLEYFYDIYDGSGNLLPTLTGSDHVQGTIAISSNGYANTSQSEIRWALDTATASQFLIHRSQNHNAFGDISSETDGRGNTTDLVYNTEGKLTQKIAPLVGVTNETGVTTNARPTDNFYYDKSGRQVAQRDANGNLTTQVLLAGTGYGGSKALATAEYRPGSATTSGYDVWGDQRKVTDGNGAVTAMLYDAAHNLIEVDHAARVGGNSPGAQLVDHYSYDALGERIKHWNSQLGAGAVETTDYDAMGRIVSTTSLGGQTTSYVHNYADPAWIVTMGLGNFGGWQTITTTPAGITQYENHDIFGHIVWRQDYGGHTYGYTYDLAGHLVQQTNSAGQNIQFTYYENGYVSSVTDNALKLKSTFAYDNDGNRTLETYNSTDASPVYYQNAAITYDAMNRTTLFHDAKADITYKYDAVGNRRNVRSEYQDGVNGGQQLQDYWYKYDGQNRFVLTMGTRDVTSGVISRGATGIDVAYDAAGNRATATYGYDNHTEAYTYTADGYLEDSYFSGARRSSRTADAMGRTTQYTEYAANGVTATMSRSSTFDNDNRVTSEMTDTIAGSITSRTTQTYDYRSYNGTSYAGADQGIITHVRADNFTVGQSNHIYTDTNTYYTYWDEAKQSSIRVGASNPNNANSGQWAPGMSSLTYDVNGHITTLVDQTALGGPTTVTYRNDAYGQVLVREESKNGVIGPRQLYYYFAGMRIGDVGNNGPSPSLIDYAQELATRGATQPAGLYRAGRPVASADFDENYQPINAGYPGAAPTSYTVRSGDTLYSIASALWGDQAMWFLIAEANGITAATSLVPGQRLIIPNKVTNFHNTSGTFRVYDAGEAIGDTMPTLPNEPAPPPAVAKKKGCGVFGQILGFIISIAVSYLLPGVGQVLGNVIGKAIGGAIGGAIGTAAGLGIQASLVSAVSQGIGVAAGIQDSFSWKSVGMSALTSFVGGTGAFQAKGGSFGAIAQNVAVGAATNAAIQGIAIAAGLQDQFSWGSVAAAGASGGVGSAINSRAGPLAKSVAQGLASAAVRSLVDGTDFGDNLLAELPDVIRATIGNFALDRTSKKDSFQGQARGKIASADGPSDVMSDIGSSSERAMAEALCNPDIVVVGKKMSWLEKALYDLAHLYGSTPRVVSTTYSAPKTGREQAKIANAELGGRLLSAIGAGADYLYRGTIGPETFANRAIIKPVNSAFYGTLGLVANSPLGDIGAITSMETSGVPFALLAGESLTGIRYLAALGGTARVARGAEGLLAADDPLAGFVASAASAEAIGVKLHKNSLSYVGDTHVYVIRGPDGFLYKVGESAQGVRLADGASIRAEQQARRLLKETGEFYTTEIRNNFGGKADARAYETKTIETYERLFGKRPPGNPLNR